MPAGLPSCDSPHTPRGQRSECCNNDGNHSYFVDRPRPARPPLPTERAVTGRSCQATLDQLVRVGILCVACLGAAAVFGYFFDIPGLAAWTTSPMSMKVNTAYGLIAAAAALWLVHACAPESMWVRVARGL